jgi:hypothetical protein
LNPHGEKVKRGVPQGSLLGHILFFCVNDLPKLSTIGTKILLYADDNSIMVTCPDLENLETQTYKIFAVFNNWFKINKSLFNYNKTHYLQFRLKSSGIMI